LVSWASVKAVRKRLASEGRAKESEYRESNGKGWVERTLRVGETDGESLGGRLALGDVSGDVVDPRAVGSDVRGKSHLGGDCGESLSVSWQRRRVQGGAHCSGWRRPSRSCRDA
jgi:hypothetical protein